MQTEMNHLIQERYHSWVRDHSSSVAKIHAQMLSIRQAGLMQIAAVLTNEFQAHAAGNSVKTKPIYDRDWLETFATGDITKCLGNAFGIYDHRRCPRIPNGDFLLMSRITQIQGSPGTFDESSHITAEYDVPANAWFLDGGQSGRLPVSFLLEIALQPCGVLTAWLGTLLRFPELNYFFRNLDGKVKLLHNIPLRGKTVKTNATLTRTVFSGTIIIQHFDFEITADGTTILQGTSSFGYFPEETMASQVGLDGGKPTRPWGLDPKISAGPLQTLPGDKPFYPGYPTGRLRLVDEVQLSLWGGAHGNGYAMASRKNSPGDWFYANHFYQDPVMPGSLGIEAILQTLKAWVYTKTNADGSLILSEGGSFSWQYRGQILPKHQTMRVEVHLKDQPKKHNKSTFLADASLWADDIRIYSIQNLAIEQSKEGLT